MKRLNVWETTKECSQLLTEQLTDGFSQVDDDAKRVGSALWSAAQYCSSSAHLLECYERLEMAMVGTAVTSFGITLVIVGCGTAAPVVGAATAGVGGVATCGMFIFAGGTIIAGGVLIVDASVSPWHHGEAADSSNGHRSEHNPK